MNLPIILTREILALDSALAERTKSLTPSLDREGQYFVRHWVGGTLMTMGCWSTPRDAMAQFPEVAHWIEVTPREFRSDCGRWICHDQ